MTPLITLPRATVEQALEALEDAKALLNNKDRTTTMWFADEITALRTALAQRAEPVEPITRLFGTLPVHDAQQAEPVQQPYCYVYEYDGVFGLHREFYPLPYNGMKPSRTVPVYTAPPQRKPLPKHDQHCVDVPGYGLMPVRLVRAVERAHNITDPQIADRLARHGIPMPGDPK